MTHWISYSEPGGSRIAKTLQAQGEDTFAYPVTRIQRLPLPRPMPEAFPISSSHYLNMLWPPI